MADFTGHIPSRILRVQKRHATRGLIIGELDGVLYSAVRDGRLERYIHRFRQRSRPLLTASADGKQLDIVGGRFQFTEAGIEDR
jgi:hypothetical protein